jgi:preprotein translocase subunit SecD
MLYFSRWKVIAILLTAAVVCSFAIPNFFPEAVTKTWPAWAQRRLVLGLDLQGGSQILLEVDLNDVRKQRLDSLRDDARRSLREAQRMLRRNAVLNINMPEQVTAPLTLSAHPRLQIDKNNAIISLGRVSRLFQRTTEFGEI